MSTTESKSRRSPHAVSTWQDFAVGASGAVCLCTWTGQSVEAKRHLRDVGLVDDWTNIRMGTETSPQDALAALQAELNKGVGLVDAQTEVTGVRPDIIGAPPVAALTVGDVLGHVASRGSLVTEGEKIIATLPAQVIEDTIKGVLGLDTEKAERLAQAKADVLTVVIDALIDAVGSPTSAPEGKQDECLSCYMPITRKGGQWVDDFIGSEACGSMGIEHQPKDTMAEFEKRIAGKSLAAKNTVDAYDPGKDGSGWWFRWVDVDSTQDSYSASNVESNMHYVGPFATEEGRDKAYEAIQDTNVGYLAKVSPTVHVVDPPTTPPSLHDGDDVLNWLGL